MLRSIGAFRSLPVIAAVLCAGGLACNKDDPAAPSPVPDRAVAVSYCAGIAPTWVAFRDGDGEWTRETPSVTGSTTTFRHSFTSNRAAIASLTPVLGGEFSVLRVLYGAPDELSTDGDTTSADCLTGGFKSLRGTVSGIATTEAAFIAVGPLARTGVVPREGLDFTIDGVAAGPQDLLAVRTAQAAPPRLIIRRDLDLPNGAVVPTLDFASAEAFDMVTATLTIGNLGGDGDPVVDFSVLTTPHGEFFLPIAASGNGSPQPYLALPADKLLAGDVERLHVSANGNTSRTADLYFRTPTDRIVTLGSRIEPPTMDVIAGGNTARLRAHYAAQADYDKVSSIVYNQPTSTGFVAISMTPAYAALVGGYDLDVPDLGSVPGFDPAWALQAGVINWTATRTGGTLPLARDAKPIDGATRRTSLAQGTITLP